MNLDPKKLIPIAFVGCFITSEIVREWFEDCGVEFVPNISNIAQTIKTIITSATTDEDRALIKDILIFPRFISVGDEEDDDQDGWYIGTDSFIVPHHVSLKRICIDLRNIFIKAELMFDDDDNSIDGVLPLAIIIDTSKLQDL
jgi:hypothetical protein